MGDPIKAEQVAKHFAAVTSPSMRATPYGQRSVPSLGVVSFEHAVGVAQRTYGNSAPLFLLRSRAIDPASGTYFVPEEGIDANPVEGSLATCHGLGGTLYYRHKNPDPALINCGVLRGPTVECSAELAGLIAALTDRIADEINSDLLGFADRFYSGWKQGVTDTAGEQADTLKGVWNWLGDKASSGYAYVRDTSIEQVGSDAVSGIVSGVGAARDAVVGGINAVADAADALGNLSLDDIKSAVSEWLKGLVDSLGCDACDLLADILHSPKPLSTQLGEVTGAASVYAAETALTAGAGAAAGAALKGADLAAQATTATGKMGQLIGKLGDKAGNLFEKLKARLPGAKKIEESHPSHVPEHSAPPKVTEPKGNSVEGKSAKPEPDCLSCATVGKPVNAIYGCKILEGEADLDFVIDGLLPLAWQRTYVSSNAHEGWLGQGWTLPIGFRLDMIDGSVVFVDLQGRRTRFAPLAVGERFTSPYEHNTLFRAQRNRYELIGPDGLRLVFGLSASDRGRVSDRDAEEDRQSARLAAAMAAFHVSQNLTEEAPATPEAESDRRASQADSLVLLAFIDANDNWLRLHYTPDDLPHVIESSAGDHVGLIFAPSTRAGSVPRLQRVLQLFGKSATDHSFAASRVLIDYRYSVEGDLVDVVDASGFVARQFAYRDHMMIEHSEPGGVVSRYEWDRLNPEGRVVRNCVSTGEDLRFVYVESERRTVVTDASGRVTTYRYDADKRLLGSTDPSGATVRFERDSHDHVVSVTDALGHVMHYTYDADGRQVRVQQADGAARTFAYAGASRKPASITDANGATTRYTYDTRGNLTRVETPTGAATEYRIDGRGLPVAIVDARGGVTTLDHDRAGRVIAHKDCLGQVTRYAYDEDGNLNRIIDTLGHVTCYGYRRINRQARLTDVTHADGAVERYAYDALGRLIAHHDAAGHVTRFTLDADGKPTSREDALGHALRYRYDTHGRLTALTNENGAVYRFAWDLADRLATEQGFDGRRIDYRYNRAGELIESADGVPHGALPFARGVVDIVRTRYQRDPVGRLLDKISSKPMPASRPTVNHSRFAYDAEGQLVRARNGAARVDITYTQNGELSREITRTRGGAATVVAHTYDSMGNRESTTLPDGRVLRHRLYGSGHVAAVSLDDETVCEFERDALYRETVRKQGALTSYYDRDPVGRLLSSRTRAEVPRAEPAIARQYRYDRTGQLVTVDDARKGVTAYRYDPVGRLLAAQSPLATEMFAFDPASNLIDPQNPQPRPAPEKTTWTDAEWSAFVNANIANPAFNALLTPDEVSADPSQWGEVRPNRLAVWREHRYRYDAWGNCIGF